MSSVLSDQTKVLLTVREAAALISLSVSQTYELIAQKRIPSVRLGPRSIRVPLDALRSWANGSAVVEEESRA